MKVTAQNLWVLAQRRSTSLMTFGLQTFGHLTARTQRTSSTTPSTEKSVTVGSTVGSGSRQGLFVRTSGESKGVIG